MEKEENSAIVIDIRALMASFNYSIKLFIWGIYISLVIALFPSVIL